MTTPHPEDMPEVECCPFCGGHDISEGEVLTECPNGRTTTQSMCRSCGALGPEAPLQPGEIDYGSTKATAAWNRRPPSLAEQRTRAMREQNELLRDALSNLIETYGTDSPMWWQARSALTSTPPSAPGKGEAEGKDAARLDWLDATNARFKMGWEVGKAPAGNVSIRSVVQLGRALRPIRDAIDAAMNPGPLERMQKIDDELGEEP